MFDGKAFGEQMVEVVRSYVDAATAPLLKRIEAQESEIASLKGRAAIPGEPGRDGASITLDDVAPIVADAVERAVKALPTPKDGRDGASVDPGEVDRIIADRLNAAIKALPHARDGVDGKDGVGVSTAAIDRDGGLVLTLSNGAICSLGPVVGRDGKHGEPGRAGRDGVDGKDGVTVSGAMIDRDGALILNLSNGETRSLGVVVGRDGKDGERGPPGRDALRVQDIDLTLEPDGRTLLITLDDGDVSFAAEIGVPTMIYRGVFKESDAYERGDTVTWAGSLWHCNATTTDRPGEGSDAWTLAVKRGRDAKPAVL